jgi:hypothetical protein
VVGCLVRGRCAQTARVRLQCSISSRIVDHMASIGNIIHPKAREARRRSAMTSAECAMDEHVRRVVDAAPPLTPEQVLKPRGLLTPSREVATEIEAKNAEVRRKLCDPVEWADVVPVREKIARRGSWSM